MIKADWPAPDHIFAGTTTGADGNMAIHVDNNIEIALQNRAALRKKHDIPSEPVWLQQEHTDIIVTADQDYVRPPLADASYCTQQNRVCVVMTADCLPVLICNKQGTIVSAVHAGWRGLANGILLRSIEKLPANTEDLLVWFGPAIGKEVFEVGDDVRNLFLSQNTALPEHFIDHEPGKYFCDMLNIARYQLAQKNIFISYGGEHCTYTDKERFYSYRRDGQTGRMASFILIKSTTSTILEYVP